MADLDLLLADTSAWHHSANPAVAAEWRRFLEEDKIAITEPVILEVLFSARNATDYDSTLEKLEALHRIPCNDDAFARALEVQRALAHKKSLHHRSVMIPDLLIAAVAEIAGVTVWHYDSDFDRISEITGQSTKWIVPRGQI